MLGVLHFVVLEYIEMNILLCWTLKLLIDSLIFNVFNHIIYFVKYESYSSFPVPILLSSPYFSKYKLPWLLAPDS